MRLTPADGGAEVAADPDFPVNGGLLCIKGMSAGELLTRPGRLRHPAVRGADGRLRRASWGAALDELAGRLEAVRARHGAEALGVFGSGALTNEKAYLLGKFARVALRTPNVDYNGRYCMASAAAGQNRAFGLDRGLPFPVSDIADADVVLLWGSNCADTMPPIMQWFERQRANGGTLIVADPRRSATARAGDLHLQLVPGSDLALANGLLHVAVVEGLVDERYLAERTVGWEEVRRSALAHPPDLVERISGVPGRLVRETVRRLAAAPAAMLLSGRGPEQQSKGSDTVLAFTNLMLALGKVGRPASGYGCLTGQGNGQGGREHGQKADQLPGYRLIADPDARRAVAEVWGIDPDDLPGPGLSAYELLSTLGEPGGVRGLLVMGSNVVVASPDNRRVIDGLRRLEFLAVLDAFPNDTSVHADVVLPVLQWAEEEGTMTNLEGRVIRRRRAVAPPPGARSDLEVLVALAERLGEGARFPSAEPADVFDELRRASAGGRADYSGISHRRIDAEGGVFWPCREGEEGTPRLFAERFAHPDGRARMVPVAHRRAGEEPDADYPLWFTTGRLREHYNSGAQTRRVERLTEAAPEPRVEIHPFLAGRLGLEADDRILVESRRGAVTLRPAVSAEIRPDTVFAPFHWGGRQAANALTSAALDPVSRMPEFKVCAVRVRRVEAAVAA
jgi:assimilatory nitrate reductase catalytic subunit